MKQGERGLTLIELTVTVAIVALIAAGANMSVFQVLKGTERNNDHMTAVNQVQNAGYWISRDAQMAKNITTENLTPPEFLVLAWTEEDTDPVHQHQVIYTLEAMPGSELKRLRRSHSVDGGAVNTALVAQYIDPDPGMTKCQFINGTLTLTVTASINSHSQTKTETRVYEVVPRPG